MTSRQLALETLLEWEHGETYAQELIDQAAIREQLSKRDAALLQALVFSTLRNILLLDDWIGQLCENRHLEDRVQWLLRMGLAQLLLLDHPPHAAVNETVSLAPDKARGLVNAVLRRTLREKDSLLRQASSLPLADRYSHPDWLVERWVKQYGVAKTEQLCQWNQEQPVIYIRINQLHPNPLNGAALEELPTGPITDFYQVSQPPLDWLDQGLCYTQDPSTSIACHLLAPQPGETVLDACAAPGGKTALLAQLMNNQGVVYACDSSPKRLRRLQGNLSKLHVTNAQVIQQDWTKPSANHALPREYDRILLDAPCSNTGVMKRRIDVRWRLEPPIFTAMQNLQISLLDNLLSHLKPGGTLVYSTCSLDYEENELVVEKVLQSRPSFKLTSSQHSHPWVTSMDGAFAACIKRDA